MLVNFNSSFNRPSYNQYYSDYSQAFQRDNYKCKSIPSNQPNGKLEGNEGFINAGNKTVRDFALLAAKLPDFDNICTPRDMCDPLPPIIYPCERDYPKVDNCIVYQCNESGHCFTSGFLTPAMPWFLNPFWDIFIEDPFFNHYNPPDCTPIEGMPCEDICKSEKRRLTEQDVFNAIYDASQQLDSRRAGRVLIITYRIQGDAFSPSKHKSWLFIKPNPDDPGEPIRPIDPGDFQCTKDCNGLTPQFWATLLWVGGDPDCNIDSVHQQQKTCIKWAVYREIYYFEPPNYEKPVCGIELIYSEVYVLMPWNGTFYNKIPDIAKNACSVSAVIATVVYYGDGTRPPDVRGRRDRGGDKKDPPPEYDPPRKPKEDPPPCMQACTCEQIQALLQRQKKEIVECLGFQPCEEQERNRRFIDNLTTMAKEYVSASEQTGERSVFEELLRRTDGKSNTKITEILECCNQAKRDLDDLKTLVLINGERILAVDDCCDTIRNIAIKKLDDLKTLVEINGERILAVNECCDMVRNTVTRGFDDLKTLVRINGERILAVSECCDIIRDKLLEIRGMLLALPENVALALAPEIEVILGKLNEILRRMGGDDDLASKIIQIITLLATLLGLVNDLKSLLGQQKDYTDDLEALKQLAQEIKQSLANSIQGSIDAIKCNGEIVSNTWSGQGFDGINQAITALGVNLAVLHSDLCGFLERTRQTDHPRLQGSIDAIRCDGEIISNSWDGQGFDGLNQAITALGVNLAILHADLCARNERDTFHLLDEYKCGDDVVRVSERIEDSLISRELHFLYYRLKRIETLICEQDECNAVPVFPGDTIEEREIPAQAVITFVEAKHYPKIKGQLWHISIPYPIENLVTDSNCWQRFANLTLRKGEIYGRIVWKSPNNTINRFQTGIYGHDEEDTKAFLERIARFSRLEKLTVRITTGTNPRARPKDVIIKAVKVVVMERDDQGRMVPVRCCRAPRE